MAYLAKALVFQTGDGGFEPHYPLFLDFCLKSLRSGSFQKKKSTDCF